MVAFKRVAATVAVHDMAQAREFYEGVLELRVGFEAPVGIFYQVGDTLLFLYPSAYAGSAGHTVATFEVEDVRATVAELRGKGVTFEEYDTPDLKTVDGIADLDGNLAAWFRDPVGNHLAIGEMK